MTSGVASRQNRVYSYVYPRSRRYSTRGDWRRNNPQNNNNNNTEGNNYSGNTPLMNFNATTGNGNDATSSNNDNARSNTNNQSSNNRGSSTGNNTSQQTSTNTRSTGNNNQPGTSTNNNAQSNNSRSTGNNTGSTGNTTSQSSNTYGRSSSNINGSTGGSNPQPTNNSNNNIQSTGNNTPQTTGGTSQSTNNNTTAQSTNTNNNNNNGSTGSGNPQPTNTFGSSGNQPRVTSTGPMRTSSDWQRYITQASQPTNASSWLDYLKDKVRDGARGLLRAIRNGMAGPFARQMAQNGWARNVIFAAASNSQHTVGWMDPNGKTAMGYALVRHLQNSPSLVDALRKFAGRPYPNFPRNAIAKYWNAEKVGDDNYFNSPLRFSRNTQTGSNRTKNIFVGIGGGPEGAFGRSINEIARVMKDKFNTTNFIYHRRNGSAVAQIQRAFSKIRDYARRNPNQPISLAFMLDTHGGTSGGNRLEGSGHGFTQQVDERTLKNLVNRYLGDLNNVGVHVIISACHSGAYLT